VPVKAEAKPAAAAAAEKKEEPAATADGAAKMDTDAPADAEAPAKMETDAPAEAEKAPEKPAEPQMEKVKRKKTEKKDLKVVAQVSRSRRPSHSPAAEKPSCGGCDRAPGLQHSLADSMYSRACGHTQPQLSLSFDGLASRDGKARAGLGAREGGADGTHGQVEKKSRAVAALLVAWFALQCRVRVVYVCGMNLTWARHGAGAGSDGASHRHHWNMEQCCAPLQRQRALLALPSLYAFSTRLAPRTHNRPQRSAVPAVATCASDPGPLPALIPPWQRGLSPACAG
jgi:hypothetical protein